MTPNNTAKSVTLQIENARNSAIDATKTFVTGITEAAAESAGLSRLENLHPAVRAALSRLDQVIRNEANNINDIITRTTHAPAKPSVHLVASKPDCQPSSDPA